MQLILIKHGQEGISVIEIPHDSDGALLAQMVQVELNIPIREQHLEFEGVQIHDEPLLHLGIVDGATIIVKHVSQAKLSIYDVPADAKPEELLAITQTHPHLLLQFMSADPELGTLLQAGDVVKLRTFIMKRMMSSHKVKYERKQEEIAFANNPDDPVLQKKMEERIRLENIQQNMEAAMENLPESFGRVIMLYVDIEVNGHPIKAFVDSGAQSTIMSARCAEQCGISRLIDTRFAGVAVGVGSGKILGRVHIAQMKFGKSHFPISITVLESSDVDFLFGLDTLRRYRCCIDLGKNCLRIDGHGGVEEVTFLSENEIPERARGNYNGPPSTGDSSSSSSSSSSNSSSNGGGSGSERMI